MVLCHAVTSSYRFSVQLLAARPLPTLCRRAEWQNNREGKQPA